MDAIFELLFRRKVKTSFEHVIGTAFESRQAQWHSSLQPLILWKNALITNTFNFKNCTSANVSVGTSG